MNCKKLWNREFIDANCTKTFRNKELKNHRENILFERQQILLPETQKDVIIEKTKRNIKRLIAENEEHKRDIEFTLNDLKNNLSRINFGNTDGIISGLEAGCMFKRKCPLGDCKGFLSSKWKCGVCEKTICSRCNELKEEEHECNEDSVKSMELLKKDTKPCPTCGEMIFKIEGCSQMWCPKCHTAFSWNTGRIERGHIHNPHYYDFLRNTGGGGHREHGDIPCGGRPHVRELMEFLGYRKWFRNKLPDGNVLKQTILDIHRLISHVDGFELRYNYNFTEHNWTITRVQYLLDEISEDTFKCMLQKSEKKREKFRDITNVLRMFCDVGDDYIRTMMVEKKDNLNDVLNDFCLLRSYVNKQLLIISKRYNCAVPNIDIETWNLYKTKA
jgi:hypothetical protein